MSENIYSNQHWRPLHIRDNFMFLKGNIKGFETQVGGESGVSSWGGANNNPGAFPDTPFVIGVASCFGEAVQPGNIRSIDVEHLFNFAGTFNLPSGQSIAAIRGCQTIAAGTTFGSGSVNEYLYGVQGKQYIQGTIVAAAGFVAALMGQLDTSGASAIVTSGYVSALQLDMGATSSIVSSAYINAATILNTTNCLINSIFKVVANATYFMDLTDVAYGGAHWLVDTTAATAAGCIKVLVGGAVRYLQLYSSAS